MINYNRIQPGQFDPCILRLKLSVDFCTFCIASDSPCANLLFEAFQIRQRLSQGLAAHDTDFYFSHVQPAPMLWRIMPFKAFSKSARFFRREGLI